jgi:beta-1,2-mannosidase
VNAGNNIAKLSLLFLLCAACNAANQTGPEKSETKNNNPLPEWAFGGFVRPANTNPILSPIPASKFTDPMSGKEVAWESNDTFNPGAAIKDGKVVLLYRSEDKSGVAIGERTSRLGYAESSDGLHFTRSTTPVLFPANDSQKEFEWPGGCEDPRVAMTDDGTYVVFYTQWNRKLPRLGVATSKDLKTWTKHGPIFRNAKGNVFNEPHKSASIVTTVKDGKQVVAKVAGKYTMYWGELGVFLATSDDLIHWQPLLDETGKPKPLISPREGYFDSDLTECGPPAVLTDKGILLLYNGKNNPTKGDKRFTPNSYCGGQVLFDKADPAKAIARLDAPFFRPMEPFEKSGQYVNGTVFMEGLVYFQDKWFLYYGCADSRVGVAVFDPARPAAAAPLPEAAK